MSEKRVIKISKFSNLLLSQPDIGELERLKIAYASELLRNEAIKTVLYCIFFAVAGHLVEFLLCLAMSCTIRIFSGGIHMKTNAGCFIFGIFSLCAEILLLPKLISNQVFYLTALWLSIGIICWLSPVASYKRPFKTRDRYVLCKKSAVLFSLAWGFFLTAAPLSSWLQHCGIWYILAQALQLILQTIYRHFNKKHFTGGKYDVQKND